MLHRAFEVLGIVPMLGRTLDAGDTANPDVAVLTFDTWRRHFSANADVVGTTLELRAGAIQESVPPRLLTVVGVLPADFEFPTGPADFYTPLQPPSSSGESPRIEMIGRLASGMSPEAATDELNAWARPAEQQVQLSGVEEESAPPGRSIDAPRRPSGCEAAPIGSTRPCLAFQIPLV